MNLPPDPAEGMDILPWADAVNAYLRALTPRESGSASPNFTPDGTSWNIRRPRLPYTAPKLFEIFDSSERDVDGYITTAQVRLVESLLCGDVPGGIVDLAVADEDKIYAHVEYDTETGEVTARTIEAGASVPAASDGNAYLLIGSIDIDDDNKALTPVNDCYGPIIGCRNWFVTPLTYTLYGTGP